MRSQAVSHCHGLQDAGGVLVRIPDVPLLFITL